MARKPTASAERTSRDNEERIPKNGDKGGPLVRIVAHYEDGTSISFAHDTKAARRASKVKKGKSDETRPSGKKDKKKK